VKTGDAKPWVYDIAELRSENDRYDCQAAEE
jgi:hypothetical protein